MSHEFEIILEKYAKVIIKCFKSIAIKRDRTK